VRRGNKDNWQVFCLASLHTGRPTLWASGMKVSVTKRCEQNAQHTHSHQRKVSDFVRLKKKSQDNNFFVAASESPPNNKLLNIVSKCVTAMFRFFTSTSERHLKRAVAESFWFKFRPALWPRWGRGQKQTCSLGRRRLCTMPHIYRGHKPERFTCLCSMFTDATSVSYGRWAGWPQSMIVHMFCKRIFLWDEKMKTAAMATNRISVSLIVYFHTKIEIEISKIS